MSENHALIVLKRRKEDCESIIASSYHEMTRLNADIEEQREVIQQKTAQLDDLNAAIEKLERA